MAGRKSGWGSHALFGKIAFHTLPAWEKEIIKPDMSPGALSKPYIRRPIKTPGDKMAYMCYILDLIYFDECRPYATLPDGRWIPHSPPDSNWQSSVGSCQPISRAVSVQITEMLMTRMVDAIETDDWESAIRHGGALAHYLQEPFTPGHAMDNNLFHELFPDPDRQRHMRLHSGFDRASDMFEPLNPQLMGTSIPEAAFRLQIEIDRGIKEGKKLVVPVIRSIYEGLPDEVRAVILAQQSCKATFVTASAWHTAISIALSRFDKKELNRLSSVSLSELIPYFWHACQYVDLVSGCLVKDKRKIPIHVWNRNEDGDLYEELVKTGFGMGGHMGAKFFVNGDVYTRFRCRVGLPSRHTEGQGEHTNTKFFVEMDKEENTVYSEDMEYAATRLLEIELKPGELVHDIDVDIHGARTLILTAQSCSYTDSETEQVKFSIPHVAVCEPVLLKK